MMRTPIPAGLLRASLVMTAACTVASTACRAHEPPPVSLHYELNAEELHLTVNVEQPVYDTWFATSASLIPELLDEAYARECEQARKLIASRAQVRVDGVAVLPRVVAIEYLEQLVENDYLNYVVIDVVYGVKDVPKALELQWNEFRSEDANWPLVEVEATFEYEIDLQVFGFTPESPDLTWLRPDLPPVPEPSDLRVTVLAPLALPWASLLALLLGLAATIATVRGTLALRRGLACIAAALVLAAPLSMLPALEWRPPWRAAFEMPAEEHARYVFEALHLNVYRAFDYQTESDVYDALAQSVEAGLLDEVYDEVYRGLIIKEEGDLRSRVRGVEMLESEVEIPDRALEPRFDVACRWRVKGSVEHWGHRHLRINEYRARYTVRGQDARWRLAAVEVTDLGRVDDPEEPR